VPVIDASEEDVLLVDKVNPPGTTRRHELGCAAYPATPLFRTPWCRRSWNTLPPTWSALCTGASGPMLHPVRSPAVRPSACSMQRPTGNYGVRALCQRDRPMRRASGELIAAW